MEEEKAAAYYDELSRKGEGAAKFKQGLGFSSSSSSSNPFPSKKTSSFSSLSHFVRASSNPKNVQDEDPNKIPSTLSNFVRDSSSPRNGGEGKEDRARVLDRIQGKLSGSGSSHRRRSPSDEREKRREDRRERYDERERDEGRHSSRKSRDRDSEHRGRRRRRSSSYSPSRVSRDRERDRRREKDERRSGSKSDKGVDYSKLIEGYSQMTPAERVKAKMKLQLTQTAAKDANMGMSSGWERFDFNKDAPLDDDEDDTEVAEDDAAIVKDIGRSFRFSAVEARRQEEIKAAHDQAMFGGAAKSSQVDPAAETTVSSEEDGEDTALDDTGGHLKSTTLISDKVLSMQQGSWRDRARRLQNASEQS